MQEFPVNTTVTSLEFEDGVCKPNSETFETLIRALPNVKHFKCYVIMDNGLLALSRAAPTLESFEVKDFLISRLPEGDIFPDMKEFEVRGSFNEDLQEPTGDSNFEALVIKAVRDAC